MIRYIHTAGISYRWLSLLWYTVLHIQSILTHTFFKKIIIRTTSKQYLTIEKSASIMNKFELRPSKHKKYWIELRKDPLLDNIDHLLFFYVTLLKYQQRFREISLMKPLIGFPKVYRKHFWVKRITYSHESSVQTSVADVSKKKDIQQLLSSNFCRHTIIVCS